MRPRDHHLRDDTLVDLAARLLPSEETERALEHLKSCPACEERFRILAADREWFVSVAAGGGAVRASRGRWGFAFAGAAAVLVAALLLWALQEPVPVHDPWLPIEKEQAVLRSSVGPGNGSDLLRALEAYRDRDVGEALRRLRQARVPEAYRPLCDLYLASALAVDHQDAQAAEVLLGLDVATLPQPWRRRAQWIRYVVWLRQGRGEEAAALLETLSKGDNEIGRRARQERARFGATGKNR
jgi:hypothetical protein